MGLEAAIDRTIDDMPGDYIIRPYLEIHRAEVKSMLLTEYNEAKQMELFKEEGREEGIVEGEQKGRSRLSALFSRLFSLGRSEDAVRAANDAAYQEKLLKEFGIRF